ncbi:MAG: 5'-methylthioadenosine/S-adenosylhomocysteine nucleosidase family protein, partial [Planctomycetota bacterium]
MTNGSGDEARVGVVVALPEELGPLTERVRSLGLRSGLELYEAALGAGPPALVTIAGVGKVRAARAASLLIEAGARRALLSVGVCGGLRRTERVGDLLLCDKAVQADLALRADRERSADPSLTAAWAGVVEARRATFLTADRPVLSPWRRLRLARAWVGPCAADMETAAVAWVSEAAGVPWAALRAVSDDVGFGRRHSFGHNFHSQAGRAA